MKKLIIACMLIFVLMAGVRNSDFSLLDYFSGEYRVYTADQTESSVDLGFCHMSNCLTSREGVVGESIKIYNFEPVSALEILNAKLIKTETLEKGTVVMYAYSNLIKDNVQLDNEKVNIQIATNEDYCVIGWPLILGSF